VRIEGNGATVEKCILYSGGAGITVVAVKPNANKVSSKRGTAEEVYDKALAQAEEARDESVCQASKDCCEAEAAAKEVFAKAAGEAEDAYAKVKETR